MKRLIPLGPAASVLAELPVPRVLDGTLKIELIAAEPDINTPVGIAADAKGWFSVRAASHLRGPAISGKGGA